jgi:hypothetical protein
VSKTIKPFAGVPIASFCAVVIRGGKKPLDVESACKHADEFSTVDLPIPVQSDHDEMQEKFELSSILNVGVLLPFI